MPPHSRYKRFLPSDDARLRPAHKFVAAEHHHRYASADALPNKRFGDSARGQIDETTRAKILNKWKTGTLAKCRQFFKRRFFCKSGDPKIGRMHPQEQTSLLVDGVFVVGKPRAVRGTDFPQDRPAFRHDFRNAETIANLDQLASGNDNFAALRPRGEPEQYCGSAIVHDDGGFSACEPF